MLIKKIILVFLFLATIMPGLVVALTSPDQAIIDKYFVDDDAYYYFKIAQNVAEGHGSTFDQITTTNGYHPAWMWVLIPVFLLAKINLVLPLRIVLILCSLLHFGALMLLLLALVRMGIDILIGLGAELLLVLSPACNNALLAGTEMALNLFLVALFIFILNRAVCGEHSVFVCTNRIYFVFLGILAGLLFLVRLDNVFLLLVFTINIVGSKLASRSGSLREGTLLIASFLVPFAAIVLLYALYEVFSFGNIVPVSGQVKAYWASLGGSVFGYNSNSPAERILAYFSITPSKTINGPLAGIWRFLSLEDLSLIITVSLVGVLAFGIVKTKSARPFFLLLSASIIHVLYFALTGYVQTRYWYWVPAYVCLIFFVGLGVQGLLSSESKRLRQRFELLVLCVLLVFLGPPFFSDISAKFKSGGAGDTSYYLERAQFIETYTPADAIIGITNAGGLGYFTNRHIVNVDGLVNSYEFLESMKNYTSYLYLKQIGVNYIFIGPGYDKYEPYKHMLSGRLEYINTWSNPAGQYQHDLFRYD